MALIDSIGSAVSTLQVSPVTGSSATTAVEVKTGPPSATADDGKEISKNESKETDPLVVEMTL